MMPEDFERIREFIKDYYDEEAGFEAGITRLHLDLINGEAPDILEVSMLDYEVLTNKNIFLDLNQYLDRDVELGKDINAIYGFSADEPVLKTFCSMSMDEFIDWENKTCDFTGDNFKRVLEFVKTYEGGYSGTQVSLGHGGHLYSSGQRMESSGITQQYIKS